MVIIYSPVCIYKSNSGQMWWLPWLLYIIPCVSASQIVVKCGGYHGYYILSIATISSYHDTI